MQKHTIIIIGGGPSGASLSRYLKYEGIDSLIIEKEDHNRYKVCAGGLPVSALKISPINLQNFTKTAYDSLQVNYKNIKIVNSSLKKTFAYGVERAEFDEFLRDGLNVAYNEKFLSYEEEKDGIKVKTNKNDYFCRFLIGADGAGSRVSITSGLGKKTKFVNAEEKEIKNTLENRNVAKIYLGFNYLGYAWVWGKENSYAVGSGALKKYYKPGVANIIDKNDAPVRFFPIALWDFTQKLTRGRVALAGEAGALVDPFSAAGIYPAILSSMFLSESIIKALKNGSSSLDDYEEKLEENLYSEYRYGAFLSRLFFPLLPALYQSILKTSTLNYVIELSSQGNISYKETYNRIENSKNGKLKFAHMLTKLISKSI